MAKRRVSLVVGGAALLALAASAGAQSPWTLTIKPNTNPLVVGVCTPVRLELANASGKDAPRNAAGMLLSIADFDMSVAAAPAAAVVGRYDGANAWSACACPGSSGAMATITATYPARSLNPKALVAGVSFQSSITVPVAAAGNSGVPVGCEKLKTTTARITTATAFARRARRRRAMDRHAHLGCGYASDWRLHRAQARSA